MLPEASAVYRLITISEVYRSWDSQFLNAHAKVFVFVIIFCGMLEVTTGTSSIFKVLQ
jgi:hypothetical protein